MQKDRSLTREGEGVGSGLAVKGRPNKPTQRRDEDKNNLKCSHCGGSRHTREGCFKLVGYPDWWEDNKKKKMNKGGVSAVVQSTPSVNDTHNSEQPSSSSSGNGKPGYSKQEDCWAWY